MDGTSDGSREKEVENTEEIDDVCYVENAEELADAITVRLTRELVRIFIVLSKTQGARKALVCI